MNNDYMQKWFKKNKARILAERKFKLKNDSTYQMQRRSQNKRYYARHQNEHKKKMIAYHRKAYKKNIPYTLGVICRARIREALYNQGAVRYYPYEILIGCSWKELKTYLESQFSPGMKWKNNTHYYKAKDKAFHIDHIQSISSFDLNYGKNQLKAFNYKNMQLLFVKDHCQKTTKYLSHIEESIRRNKRMIREYKKALKQLEKGQY